MGRVAQARCCLVVLCFGDIFCDGVLERDFTQTVGGKRALCLSVSETSSGYC